MFDLSFGEIVVVSAVALIVLGPERLPDAARKLAALIRRVKQEAAQMRAHFTKDLNMESELAELRQELDALRHQSHTLLIHEKSAVEDAAKTVTQSVEDIQQHINTPTPSVDPLPQALFSAETLPDSLTSTTEVSQQVENPLKAGTGKSAVPTSSNH